MQTGMKPHWYLGLICYLRSLMVAAAFNFESFMMINSNYSLSEQLPQTIYAI